MKMNWFIGKANDMVLCPGRLFFTISEYIAKSTGVVLNGYAFILVSSRAWDQT
jgi:hypothetical protein